VGDSDYESEEVQEDEEDEGNNEEEDNNGEDQEEEDEGDDIQVAQHQILAQKEEFQVM
jgi:hypothetical protein